MISPDAHHLTELDQRLADALVTVPGVVAVVLGGSRASGLGDAASDTDLYAFHDGDLGHRLTACAAVLGPLADDGRIESCDDFGPETHLWVDQHLVEVVHLDLRAIEADVARAYTAGLFDEMFATAFLHTVVTALPVHDHARLAAARSRLAESYPEPTRQLLINQLPGFVDTYLAQVRSAASRGDLEMVVWRRACMQMVWFNLLFAVNRRYHPGEKRLLTHAASLSVQPARMLERWGEASRMGADDPRLVEALTVLWDDLSNLVR